MSKILPKFLYHLSTRANYESIISSGSLNTLKNSGQAGRDGLFMAELNNLFKRWHSSKDWNHPSLLDLLLKKASRGGSSELVILRIPTKNLNVDQLRIRSQNRLFGAGKKYLDFTKKRDSYIMEELEKLKKMNLSESEQIIQERKIWERAMEKFPQSIEDKLRAQMHSPHNVNGAPAIERRLYEQRKEAIEYIYSDNIPASQVEKIGSIKLDEFYTKKEYTPDKPLRSVFSALLRGNPEEKGALLLNC